MEYQNPKKHIVLIDGDNGDIIAFIMKDENNEIFPLKLRNALQDYYCDDLVKTKETPNGLIATFNDDCGGEFEREIGVEVTELY